MSVMALSLPDADDLDAKSIRPLGELQSCNHLLDDHAALVRFYEDNGYILLRGVLNPESVARARDEMLEVAAMRGLVRPGDKTAEWTGKPCPPPKEEDPDFAGISRRLIEHPDNLEVMEKVLGEPACMVPNVQYRTYPPNGPVTRVHQDGFYSPGIQDYKPVWVPLVSCPREVGGLVLAVGQNNRGYFHNVDKPSFPIPVGVIPEESWASTTYEPGDVLIVHPCTAHAGMPNTSDRLRITFDTRVQSARNPSAFAATVKSVTPASVTVEGGAVGERTYSVDEETFLRPLDPGVRESFDRLTEVVKPGMRLTVVVEGGRAAMLRRAAEG